MAKTKNYRFDLPESTVDLLMAQSADLQDFKDRLVPEFYDGVTPSMPEAVMQFRQAEHLRYRFHILSETIRDRAMTMILQETRQQMGELWGQHTPGQREATFEVQLPGYMPRCVVHFYWKPNQKRKVPCEFQITFPDDELLQKYYDISKRQVIHNF